MAQINQTTMLRKIEICRATGRLESRYGEQPEAVEYVKRPVANGVLTDVIPVVPTTDDSEMLARVATAIDDARRELNLQTAAADISVRIDLERGVIVSQRWLTMQHGTDVRPFSDATAAHFAKAVGNTLGTTLSVVQPGW